MQNKWAGQIVQTLVDQGVTYMVFGSGYRLSPVLVAALRHPKVVLNHQVDERGAAYRALGWARATKTAAAVLTTSGTAVANVLPAVTEASLDRVPLLVISADRPLEMLDCGANQTMDQSRLFGLYLRHFHNLSLNEGVTDDAYLAASVSQACRLAQGPLPGPVQINCGWREPLEPDINSDADHLLASCHTISPNYCKANLPKELIELFQKGIQGLILAGSGLSERDAAAILQLAEALGWPVCPDVLSGLRLHSENANLLFYYEDMLQQGLLPPVKHILCFGRSFVSKKLHQWMVDLKPYVCVSVLDEAHRHDVHHRSTHHVRVAPALFCQTLVKDIKIKANASFVKELKKINQNCGHALAETYDISDHLEVAVHRRVIEDLDAESVLFVSNSLAIRYVDRYAPQVKRVIPVAANRGVSGIDGVVSTALGFAEGHHKAMTLLIGDLALLYDLNALQAVASSDIPIRIVVINNNGGGIFSKLPMKQALTEEEFDELYQTPHYSDFQENSAAFHLDYVCVDSLEALGEIYREAQQEEQTLVIEVKV